MRTITLVVTNLPSGHRSASFCEHLGTLGEVLRDERLRHPRTVDRSGGEGGQTFGVRLRRDVDVAALLGGGETLLA